MKPTCLVAGLFNYDTIVTRETADAPERVVSQEVGGTGGVVSKLMASLGWTTMPVCRFDDSEEGRLLRNGLAAYGCDMRYVTNLPDGGQEGARFRFPKHDWLTVPGFTNERIVSPLGCGDWTTVGFLTTLWRSGGVKFSELTPERVASALSEGQRYASRNCSYFTTCCDELLDELGVRNIVNRGLANIRHN